MTDDQAAALEATRSLGHALARWCRAFPPTDLPAPIHAALTDLAVMVADTLDQPEGTDHD